MEGTLAIILLVVSLILLLAEVFIPSGGLILITALVALVASIWLAWNQWSDEPSILWAYFGTMIVVIPTSVGLMLYWLPRTSWGKRVLLDAPTQEEITGYNDETAQLEQFIGKQGESLTLMNPGGMVLVEGERHHAESQGLLIEPRQPIEVVAVSGNRLVVCEISPEEMAPQQPADSEPSDQDSAGQSPTGDLPDSPGSSFGKDEVADDRPLDFEVPQS